MAVQVLTDRALHLQANPPSAQAITDLAQEVTDAQLTPEQTEMIQGIIMGAWANLREDAPQVRAPIPQMQDTLIGDAQTAAANGFQPALLQQFLQQAALQQQMQAAPGVQQPQQPVVAAPQQQLPQAAQQPVVAQPQVEQRQITQEAPFENLARIWQAFAAGIHYVVSFILSYIFCLPAPPTPEVTQEPQPLLVPQQPAQQPMAQQPPPAQEQVPPQQQMPQQQQAAQQPVPPQQQVVEQLAEPPPPQAVVQQQQAAVIPHQAQEPAVVLPENIQEGVVQGRGVMGQHGARVKECFALSLLETFTDLIRRNVSPERYQHYIDQGVAQGLLRQANQGEPLDLFPNIQAGLGNLGNQNYRQDLQFMEVSAIRTRGICSALIRKGDQRHVILINAANRHHVVFYHIDVEANPVQVHIYKNFNNFVQHMDQSVVIEEATPYTMQGYTVQAEV